MRELKIQLINKYIGVLNIQYDDPIDINAFTTMVKRSSSADGIVFEIVFDLSFLKEAREFLIRCDKYSGGIDMECAVNVYQSNPNDNRFPWGMYGTGEVDASKFDVEEDEVTVTIRQAGIQQKVINGMKTTVDLETLFSENGTPLPPISKIDDLELHAKSLLKESAINRQNNNIEYGQVDVLNWNLSNALFQGNYENRDNLAYGQFDTSNQTANELDGFFANGPGWTKIAEGNGIKGSIGSGGGNDPGTDAQYKALMQNFKEPRFEVYRAVERGVANINISLTGKFTVDAINTGGPTHSNLYGDTFGSVIGNIEITAWFEHRDKADNILVLDKIGYWTMPYSYDDPMSNTRVGNFETKTYQRANLPIAVDDKIYVYHIIRMFGRFERPVGAATPDAHVSYSFKLEPGEEDDGLTFINITQSTTTDSSTAKAFMIYEAMERTVQFITNQVDCFKSTLLGRTDLGYPEDGDAALMVWLNGNNLRGRFDKRVFTSLEELSDFVDSAYCAGLGYETDEFGVQRMVCEKKEYFYDKNLLILSFKNVYNIKERRKPEYFNNAVIFGYSTKVDIGQSNTIDEAMTIRKSRIPVRNTKNEMDISTKIIAGGYQIENQRRLINSTKDAKLDDANFVIVVIRDGIRFKSRKMEGYEYILGVFSPETGYNYELLPQRCLRRWGRVLASNLIDAIRSKIIEFGSGEVNYELVSKKFGELPIAEDGDYDLSFVEPIWENKIIEVTDLPMDKDEFRIVKANVRGYFELFDKDNKMYHGFISEEGLSHNADEETADLKLLKVYRNG